MALLALIAAGLLAVPPETQAQAPPENPENFAWVTNTNGITWKREIQIHSRDVVARLAFESRLEGESDEPDKLKIASIFVPEHAIINRIDVEGCINLTNIVIQPARAGYGYSGSGRFRTSPLTITGENSGLRNITAQRTMMNSIVFSFPENSRWSLLLYNFVGTAYNWIPALALTIQWTELELPKIEMRMRTTANGQEVEVI